MGFAVLTIQKGKGSSGGLDGHIDRTSNVPNADKDREHLNRYLDLDPDGKMIISNKPFREGSLHSRSKNLIEKYHEGRKPRTDAVTRMQFILSGSQQDMKNIESDPDKLKKWLYTNYAFMANEFGKENIIEFACHRDEASMHIHAIICPITHDLKSGRKKLCAKDLMSREKLISYQDKYSELMREFGMIRGIRQSPENRKTNIPTHAYSAASREQREEIKNVVAQKNYLQEQIDYLYLQRDEAKEKKDLREKELKVFDKMVTDKAKKIGVEVINKTRIELTKSQENRKERYDKIHKPKKDNGMSR